MTLQQAVKAVSAVLLLLTLLLPVTVFSQEQQTGELNVYPLLDEDGDGEGDSGAPMWTSVRIFGPIGGPSHDDEVVIDNTVPVATFRDVPYGNYYIFSRPRTTFFEWECNANKIVDEPVEHIVLDCERTGLRLFGLFIPLAATAPLMQTADTADHQAEHELYLPYLSEE